MPTLAQVTRETRTAGKILAGLFFALFIIYIGISGIGFFRKVFFPTPPPPFEMKFGRLPALSYSITGPVPTEYTINTVSGLLPSIGTDRLMVYKTIKFQPNLLALQTVRRKMNAIGFSSPETAISDVEYKWSNGAKTISYNILTNNFDLASNYIENASAIPLGGMPLNPTDYFNQVGDFLENKLSLDISDLNIQSSLLTYYSIANGSLVKVEKSTDAQVARVDVFQNSIPVASPFYFTEKSTGLTDTDIIKEMRIYYPIPNSSTMYFVFAPGSDNNASLVEARYYHQYIDLASKTTYPVKTTAQAFEDLKNGRGIITNNSQNTIINITSVSLGYFLEPNQDYVYPIYIFSSGKTFTGYVVALANPSIAQ